MNYFFQSIFPSTFSKSLNTWFALARMSPKLSRASLEFWSRCWIRSMDWSSSIEELKIALLSFRWMHCSKMGTSTVSWDLILIENFSNINDFFQYSQLQVVILPFFPLFIWMPTRFQMLKIFKISVSNGLQYLHGLEGSQTWSSVPIGMNWWNLVISSKISLGKKTHFFFKL